MTHELEPLLSKDPDAWKKLLEAFRPPFYGAPTDPEIAIGCLAEASLDDWMTHANSFRGDRSFFVSTTMIKHFEKWLEVAEQELVKVGPESWGKRLIELEGLPAGTQGIEFGTLLRNEIVESADQTLRERVDTELIMQLLSDRKYQDALSIAALAVPLFPSNVFFLQVEAIAGLAVGEFERGVTCITTLFANDEFKPVKPWSSRRADEWLHTALDHLNIAIAFKSETHVQYVEAMGRICEVFRRGSAATNIESFNQYFESLLTKVITDSEIAEQTLTNIVELAFAQKAFDTATTTYAKILEHFPPPVRLTSYVLELEHWKRFAAIDRDDIHSLLQMSEVFESEGLLTESFAGFSLTNTVIGKFVASKDTKSAVMYQNKLIDKKRSVHGDCIASYLEVANLGIIYKDLGDHTIGLKYLEEAVWGLKRLNAEVSETDRIIEIYTALAREHDLFDLFDRFEA